MLGMLPKLCNMGIPILHVSCTWLSKAENLSSHIVEVPHFESWGNVAAGSINLAWNFNVFSFEFGQSFGTS